MEAVRLTYVQGVGELVSHLLDGTGGSQKWIYRGQAEAAWETTSSARRALDHSRISDAGSDDWDRYSKIWDDYLDCLYTRCDSSLRDHIDKYHKAMSNRDCIGSFQGPYDHWIQQADGRYRESFGELGVLESGLLAMGQHYGLPTPLIDFTSNPLVALYFAARECRNSDFSVLALKLDHARQSADVAYLKEGLALAQKAGEAATANSGVIDEMSLSKVWPLAEVNKLIDLTKMARVSEWLPGNLRVEAQRSILIRSALNSSLEHQLEFLQNYNERSQSLATKFILNGGSRAAVMKELKTLGVTAFSLFPDIAGCAEYARDSLNHDGYSSRTLRLFAGFYAGQR